MDRNLFLRDVRYGAAGLALGMPTIPLLVHLPAAYAEGLGLGLTATGAALFAARALDVITDPIIGIASDRLKSPWGRRKPLILVGAIIAAVGALYLLGPQQGVGPWYLAIWAAVMYLGWTLIMIPYQAWGADLSNDYAGRTRVTSVREGFMLGGILLAGAIPAAAVALGYDERVALLFVAWAAIAIGAPLFVLLLVSVAEPMPKVVGTVAVVSPWRDMRSLIGNRPFCLLLTGWFINNLANGIPAVLFILYMKHVLGADELTRGLLTFSYFLAGVCGIPVWNWLAGRWDKHRVWCAAMTLACLAFAFAPLLGAGDIAAFFFICLASGFALGADMAIPPSMQADVAEYEYWRTRHDRTSLMFGFWSMTVKLAFAFSVLIAFPSLEWFGFQIDKPLGSDGVLALSMIYAAVPVVLKVLAIALIWRHPLTSRRQTIVRERLLTLENRIEDPDRHVAACNPHNVGFPHA